MGDKITIEINPLVLFDLLKGCRTVIKEHKANIEYLLLAENPVSEEHKKIAENITKSLNILLETENELQEVYDRLFRAEQS